MKKFLIDMIDKGLYYALLAALAFGSVTGQSNILNVAATAFWVVVFLGWLVMHYHNAASEQKTRADNAEQQVNAAQTITSNVLTTMTIFNLS